MYGSVQNDFASSGRTGVSARTVLLWFVGFVIWGVVRQKLVEGPIGEYGFDLLNRISVLEIAEVYLIVRLALIVPADERIKPLVAFFCASLIAALVLLLRYRPSYSSGGLEVALLVISIFHPSMRTAAVAVTLFVFQYVFLAGPFLWIHEWVGRVDAAVLRSTLLEVGFPATGYGPFVVIEGSGHGINVMGACSSSSVLATVGMGYLIIVLGIRRRFIADDILWGTGLVAFTMMVNWLRLLPMAISREGHAFWHDGFGASLVALAYAGLVFAAAHFATAEHERIPNR